MISTGLPIDSTVGKVTRNVVQITGSAVLLATGAGSILGGVSTASGSGSVLYGSGGIGSILASQVITVSGTVVAVGAASGTVGVVSGVSVYNSLPDNFKAFQGTGNSSGKGNSGGKTSELKIDSGQFGKKIGKHAQDYGLDPSNPASRDILQNKINNIFDNATEVRTGEWAGLGEKLPNGANAPGQAKFYIQGNDVVVTDMSNNFVSILKDGINNLRVKGATKIWP